MFSLPSDHSKLSDIDLTRHLSEVRQAEVTHQDHDVINSWPAGWMARHFKDETRCSVPNFTGTSYDEGATNDEQKNELTILNSTDDYLANLITNPSSVVPLTTYVSNLGVPPSKKSYLDIEESIDNSWLVNEATSTFFNLHADFSTFLEIWKPNVELVNKSEVPQCTTAAVRKLKDVLPNQMTLSVAPSLFRLNSLQNKIVSSNNKKEIAIKWYCVFCFNNARFATCMPSLWCHG
uniref:Nanos-type domain-containing protein n=1 Tax=Brugia malayi TaxID=6279 RepID=A0A7I4K2Y5_BRUMA